MKIAPKFKKFSATIAAVFMALGILGVGAVATAPAAEAVSVNCGTTWWYVDQVGGFKHANRKIVKEVQRESCHYKHNVFEKAIGKKDYQQTRNTGWFRYTTYNIKTGKKVDVETVKRNDHIIWFPSKFPYKGP